MRLFIAEKPELARAIVTALGGGQRRGGYIDCGADKVTWCFGHMLSLFDPEDYDLQYKRWQMDHLPVIHVPWKKKINEDKKQQVNIIKGLLKQAKTVVHAGDPDEEGQLLVDELLQHLRCRVPVKRILINDNNTGVIKKALGHLRDNRDFSGMSLSAEARGVADQIYGYNMTRLYTLAAQKKGYQGVLSIGRVQTPILGLVVRRDYLHASHQKHLFYVVKGRFIFNAHTVEGKYAAGDNDITDDKGRLIDKEQAMQLAERITGQPASITKSDTREKKQAAPLPYNLLKLQADASRKFNIKPDEVLLITQSLREKYKLITYNRSDCEYLSDEQHADASAVMEAVADTASILSGAVKAADPAFKSRAFNSSRVGAHHGIVPTQTKGTFEQLSKNEQRIYLLIARAYVAQFFPLHTYRETKLSIDCIGHTFTAGGKKTLNPGWLVLYKNDPDNDELLQMDNNHLSDLIQGMKGVCEQGSCEEKETKPPALYTMSSLLKDLTRIAKYITDSRLMKLLQEKDKNKTGEHGGIGTPATRSAIIKNLFDRNFLTEKGKKIISTETGKGFFELLPEKTTQADMTALWHAQQKDIASGVLTIEQFIKELTVYISAEVLRVKKEGLPMKVDGPECSACKVGLLIRRKGKRGFFWGCSTYPECRQAFADKKGRPDIGSISSSPVKSTGHCCSLCSKGLIRREARKKGRYFWSCSGFPDCKAIYYDNNGSPDKQTPLLT